MTLAAGVCLGVAVTAEAQPSARQAVTIRMLSSTPWALPMQVVAANFMRVNPDIKVEVTTVPPAVQGTTYQTQFRAGNAPEIVMFTAGRGQATSILPFADAGYLLNMAGRPWEKRIARAQLVGIKQGTKLWGTPMGVSLVGFVYNADLFKQLGLKRPTTWAQFLTLCSSLKAAGKIPIAFPAADVALVATLALDLAASLVYGKDPQWNVRRARGEVTFANTPGWRTVFQNIVDAKNAGCFSPGAVGTTGPQAAAQFATGEAAMLNTVSLTYGQFLQINPKLNYGILPAPPARAADQRIMLNATAIFGVNAQATGETREAALKMIDFMSRPKQQETYNRGAGVLLSGYQLRTGAIPSFYPQVKPLIPILKRNNPNVPSAVWPNAFIFPAMNTGVQGLFTGQKTPDQIVADMDAAYNRGTG
jgi:raffinose/stachyose/melibiose transport system substrate-binding protein